MKFHVYSAKYFKEEDIHTHYADRLNKVGKVSYYCERDTGNPIIELELSSLEDLITLSTELRVSLKLSRPYREEDPFQLWLIDGYME